MPLRRSRFVEAEAEVVSRSQDFSDEEEELTDDDGQCMVVDVSAEVRHALAAVGIAVAPSVVELQVPPALVDLADSIVAAIALGRLDVVGSLVAASLVSTSSAPSCPTGPAAK